MIGNLSEKQLKAVQYWKEVFRLIQGEDYQSAFRLIGKKSSILVKWYKTGLISKKEAIEYYKYLDLGLWDHKNSKIYKQGNWELISMIIHVNERVNEGNESNSFNFHILEYLSTQLINLTEISKK